MTSWWKPLAAAASIALIAWLSPLAGDVWAGELPDGVQAPEFTHASQDDWINSTPLTLAELRGEVVMLDVWTFD